jgi:hypothetical protein
MTEEEFKTLWESIYDYKTNVAMLLNMTPAFRESEYKALHGMQKDFYVQLSPRMQDWVDEFLPIIEYTEQDRLDYIASLAEEDDETFFERHEIPTFIMVGTFIGFVIGLLTMTLIGG